ncbi:hypothetical protein BT96DRAFT_829998, partial [Gymnopus androsaceus JB14]
LELIDLILEYAEYWPCIRCDSNCEIDAEASRTISNEAAWLYLMSPPIPPKDESKHRRIRKITFQMESHDQGWASTEVDQGTYNGSWSWFEAVIFRASASPFWLDLTSDPTSPFNLGAKFNSSDLKELFPEPDPNGWHIQSNVVASKEPRWHSVTWTEFEDEEAHRDPTSSKGREGIGHELVRLLEPGDRVMLIAKARFRGWSNHVSQGSIEIYYSV